jgi:hypothetical protein
MGKLIGQEPGQQSGEETNLQSYLMALFARMYYSKQ